MRETIQTFLYNNGLLRSWSYHLVALSLATMLSSLPVPALLAAVFTEEEIAKAVMSDPIVPSDAKGLATRFLEQTLPKLLTNDIRLIRQFGFSESLDDTVSLGQTLPLIRIYRNDILKWINEKSDPLFMANNTNNWVKDNTSRLLVPRRLIFPIKIKQTNSDSDSNWSSITIEQSESGGNWRIIQAGAPKLSGAMKREIEKGGPNGKFHFLLWIPDLNRHYLGQVLPRPSDVSPVTIILTTLFDDRLTHRKAGDQFEITDNDFIMHLKQLFEDLAFPKKLPRSTQGQPGVQGVTQQNQIQQNRIESR